MSSGALTAKGKAEVSLALPRRTPSTAVEGDTALTALSASASSRPLCSAQTQILRENINDQLNRLFTQLEDLEELKDGQSSHSSHLSLSPPLHLQLPCPPAVCRAPLPSCAFPLWSAEFSAEEYEETKAETLNQLSDFQAFLQQALSGDLTLVDEFGAASLAIQAAVSNAFKTPEVIRLFAQRQPQALRVRLEGLKRDFKVRKMGRAEYVRGSVEVLEALKKMGSELSEEEQEMLTRYGEGSGQGQLEDVGDDEQTTVNAERQQSILSQAKAQISKAHQ